MMDARREYSQRLAHRECPIDYVMMTPSLYQVINVSGADYSSAVRGLSQNLHGWELKKRHRRELQCDSVMGVDTFRSRKQGEKTRGRMGLNKRTLWSYSQLSLVSGSSASFRGILPNRTGLLKKRWRNLITITRWKTHLRIKTSARLPCIQD